MSSVTSWTRLEPLPRSSDLAAGLRAELADPLWLLARQWQLGELAGEDAGSPVDCVTRVEVAPVTRFHAGMPGSDAHERSVDVVDPAAPLEPLVERREVAGGASDEWLRVEAGQHFLRLLAAHGADDQRDAFVGAFLVTVDRPTTPDPASVLWRSSVAERVPDGRGLADAFAPLADAAGRLTALPDTPAVPADRQDDVRSAAKAYLQWWTRVAAAPAGDAWDPYRLEYGFAVQAHLSDGDVVLRAEEYRGGHLDWYAFDADTQTDLGAPATLPPVREVVRHTLPTRASYPGMPAERFWEIEDGSVRFGTESVGRTDVAHLLLDEFALPYGNDWWVVPVTLPVGSVAAVREVRVLDTFGVPTDVRPAAVDGAARWGMYDLSLRPGAEARASGLLYLAPATVASQEGDALEEVTWFRDEMANVVWAVERVTESSVGGRLDHRPERTGHRPAGTAQRIEGDMADAALVYRLGTDVPDPWFPLVPVRPTGAPPGVVDLELRTVTRVGSDGSRRTPAPRGRFLTAREPMRVAEEEVGRSGLSTRLSWQLARGADGRYHVWLAHRVGPGHGEGDSGLRFDVARRVAR